MSDRPNDQQFRAEIHDALGAPNTPPHLRAGLTAALDQAKQRRLLQIVAGVAAVGILMGTVFSMGLNVFHLRSQLTPVVLANSPDASPFPSPHPSPAAPRSPDPTPPPVPSPTAEASPEPTPPAPILY